MNNMRKGFHKWCAENNYDIGAYRDAPVFVYNCRVTDKAWELWQVGYRAGYDDCADDTGASYAVYPE